MARIYVLLPLRRPPSIRQPEKRLTLPTTAAVRSISALTKPEVGMLGGRHTRNQAVRCHWRIPLASYSHLRRTFSGIPSSRFAPSASSPSPSSPSPTEQEAVNEPRLSLTFTCTASITSPDVSSGPSGANASSEPLPVHQCRHRSSHTFTKRAYEKGIVIIACPSCKNRYVTRILNICSRGASFGQFCSQ